MNAVLGGRAKIHPMIDEVAWRTRRIDYDHPQFMSGTASDCIWLSADVQVRSTRKIFLTWFVCRAA